MEIGANNINFGPIVKGNHYVSVNIKNAGTTFSHTEKNIFTQFLEFYHRHENLA